MNVLAKLSDKVVVITGAGSGMGRAMALLAAQHGARLSLSDWNEAALAETAELASDQGARKVATTVIDVSDRVAVRSWASRVVEACVGRRVPADQFERAVISFMSTYQERELFAEALEAARSEASTERQRIDITRLGSPPHVPNSESTEPRSAIGSGLRPAGSY